MAKSINEINADRYMAMANEATQKGAFTDALVHLAMAYKETPQNANVSLKMANLHNHCEELEIAASAYHECLSHAPENEAAFYGLATVYFKQNKYQDAVTLLQRALAVKPNMERSQTLLGQIYLDYTGAPEAALPIFQSQVKSHPNSVLAHELYGRTLLRLDQYDRARVAYQKATELDPKNINALIGLGNSYRKMGRAGVATRVYKRALALNGNNIFALNAIVQALHDWGRNDQAAIYGRKVLQLKNQLALKTFRNESKSLDLTPPTHATATRFKNVISFSLWGKLKTYTEGAIENAKLAITLFPDWVCRFYCDDTVPQEVRDQLSVLGSEVVMVTPAQQKIHGSFWRFFVADDPSVDRFMCRDCDCRLNGQEKAAIEAWVASGRPFHIMRDHVIHIDLMLAGLWGGTAGHLPHLETLVTKLYGNVDNRWNDQLFLQDMIWPLIKQQVLIHDTHYRLFGAVTFPEGSLLGPPLNVGKGFQLS